jgi:ATP-dependent Zn protease
LLEPTERRQAAYEVAGRVLIAWHMYGVKPAGRITLLADQPGDMYKVTIQLGSEQNAFLACSDLALAGTVAQELAGVALTDEAECQPDRALELARLCLAAQGASLAVIEDQVQPLLDERRQRILRELTAARPQLDRLANLLVHEEAVEVADFPQLLGS